MGKFFNDTLDGLLEALDISIYKNIKEENIYSKIYNIITNQIAMLEVNTGRRANRIVVGVEVVQVLKEESMKHCAYCTCDNYVAEFMGIPVTIDYDNKYIISVCIGNETGVKDLFEE